MKTLSAFLRPVILLLFMLSASTGAYATHILAMDLYYTWVSGNTYKITAVIYGDCGPSSSGTFALLSTATPQVCIYKGGVQLNTIDLQIENPTNGVDVTPVCPAQVGHTQCQDPNSAIPGITRFIYSANYTLPAPTADVWYFVYTGQNTNSQAGRSNNVTNIVNPGTSTIQLIAILDNTLSNHNSNAQFSVIPTPFFCLNENDTYNPGALDPDTDSLKVIDLVSATEGTTSCQFGTPVTYQGIAWNPPFTPISAQTPLTVAPGSFIYDATTGQLNFRPNAVQRSTVVYNVQEYRNGQFVGSCQREMNFLVQSCFSTPPTGGINTVSNGVKVDSAHFTGCKDSGPFSMTFNPHESNVTNNIFVSVSGLPAGFNAPIIVNNNTPNPQITISGNSSALALGTYIFYLTYTDNNCPMQGTNTIAVSVTIVPNPTLTYNVISTTECGPKAAVDIIPGGGGAPWTITVTGATTQTFTNVTGSFVDSLLPGTNTITIKSTSPTNVCSTAVSIVVIPSDIIGDSTVCAGSSTSLSNSFTGGVWTSSNTTIATIEPTGVNAGTVTGVTAGTTIITYTFAGGCFKTGTFTVNPLPSPISGVMHVCTGLTTQLSDTLAGGIWTSADTSRATVDSFSGVVTGVDSGAVIITYTKGKCFMTATVTVELQPKAATGSPNICTDGITILTATPSGGTWSASNTGIATILTSGSGTDTVAGVFTGATVITYTLGGCSTSVTVNVVSFLPPITGPDRVCTGQSVALSDSIVGGTWSSTNTAAATVNDTAGVVVGISGGITTISYTIGGSCITTHSMTVDQSPDVGVITGLSDVCVGLHITLSDTVAGGIWTMVNGHAGISGTGVVAGVSPGVDTVLYIVSNTFCTDTATTNVTVHPVPLAGSIVGPAVLCQGDETTLIDLATGGVWTSVYPDTATITTAGVVTGIGPGVDTIKYTVSNPGCSTIASHLLTVYVHPDAGTISGKAKVCAGSSFSLSDGVSGGVWSSSNSSVATITSDSGKVSPVNPGVTVIRYTTGPNGGGCFGITTYTVTVIDKATLTIDSTVLPVSCYGFSDGSISVFVEDAVRPLQYLWSNGSNDTVITGLGPGAYSLTVTEAARLCSVTDTFRVSEPDTFVVSVTASPNICKQTNGTVVTTVSGGVTPYQYLWSDNSTGSELQHLAAGSYSVTVTDDHGCVRSLSAQVIDNDCVIVIFNALTPNGDGINDMWVIEGIDNYPTSTVQIFDKWGDIVYSKTNYNNDWDGRGKGGAVLPDGSYYYIVKLNTTNLLGGADTYTGTILIKR